jgi:hypothetical protein
MIMTVQLIQFFTFIIITAKFLSKYWIKRVLTWHRDEWLSGITFWRISVHRIINQKMSNFHFDLSLETFPRGGAYDFSGEVQKFSGEVQYPLQKTYVLIRCVWPKLVHIVLCLYLQFCTFHNILMSTGRHWLLYPRRQKKYIWLYKLS